MTDPDFEFKQGVHFRTRATGRLFVRPLEADGYDNRVLETTINEIEFKDSATAAKFMDYQRAKYASKKKLMNCRRMKMVSQYDDR